MLTTLDFLYMTLGIGAIILVIVLTVALIQAILVIRDIRKITDTAGSISEHFHDIIVTPLYYVGRISEAVGPQLEKLVMDRFSSEKKKGKKKK